MDVFFLIAGLLLLVGGGELIVRGSLGLAHKLALSPALMGLLIMGFGTSAPELLVSVKANIAGKDALAFGNVVGSNISNLWLVLGAGALLSPLIANLDSIRRDMMLMVVGAVGLVILAFYGKITPLIGIVLVIIICGFMINGMVKDKSVIDALDEPTGLEAKPLYMSILVAFCGLVGLIWGAEWLVEGASNIAITLGVSEAIVGLSIVALGTSLPELTATVMAVLKKQGDMAIANILGSNGFNSLAIPGIAAMFGTLEIAPEFIVRDIWWMLAASLTIAAAILFMKQLNRLWAFIALMAYGLYFLQLYEIFDIFALI